MQVNISKIREILREKGYSGRGIERAMKGYGGRGFRQKFHSVGARETIGLHRRTIFHLAKELEVPISDIIAEGDAYGCTRNNHH